MVDRYFDKFPLIRYGNSTSNAVAVDITKRVVVDSVVYNNPYLFYPYDLTEYERPDQFSHRYYTDAYKSWILYLSNKIVDPYYDWYLQQNEFDELIIKKYGSYELAVNKIKFYRNDWADKGNIDVNYYDSLTATQQDYWQPIYGFNNAINGYTRKQVDWVISTNKMYSYTVNNPSSFITDEICKVVFDNNNTGNGQVVSVSGNTLILQHTSGVMVGNNTLVISNTASYIYGTQSQTNTGFSTANLLTNNLSADEEVYWSPVTYYQFEYEKNEYNKSLRILDNRYSSVIVSNLKKLLSNT